MRLRSLLCWGALCVGAAGEEPPRLRIPRVSEPPKLEDYLDGARREAGVRVTGFRQYQPGDGTPVSQETTAWLSYDDRNLYVVFVCRDERGQVRARMSKREDFEGDDHVVLVLDSFHDHHRAYLFGANPYGIQYDGIYTEGQWKDPDSSFDTLWHSQGRLTAEGFAVWMAIPFKSLRFPSASAGTWGLAVGRVIARQNELSVWPYVTTRIGSFVEQLAHLEGLERISPGRNLQFIPYGLFSRARFLDTQAPAFRKDTEARVGLDTKVVLRDALTVDVALRPDFSQVESDEPQATVNQRYEVFFPEKRPFFIENGGFFETPIDVKGFYEPALSLFFSRRIADPEYGVRLTGKMGPWVMGALAMDDRAPGQRLPASHAGHERRAGAGVLRLRRDFSGQSSVGLLVASRDFGETFNRVWSLDARLRLQPNWVASGQLLRSYTREADGRRRSGPGYLARLDHSGRHLRYFSRHLDLSPDFRAELGFLRRVDVRLTEHSAEYLWRPEGRRVLALGPSVAALVNWDRQGRVQDWIAGAGFNLELAAQTKLGGAWDEYYELYRGVGFRKNSGGVSFQTDWLKWLGFKAQYLRKNTINYHPAAPLAPFRAISQESQAGCTLRPTARLRFGQTYFHSRLVRPTGSAVIFNNHILRTKVNYQFSRPLSLRAILDYNAVLPNPALVALERHQRFTADVLLTYLVNPGTAFYAGYTDRYDNLEFAPGLPPALRRVRAPGLSTGRQFFVKLSYLLRF
jgi:hypothetical protein